MSLVKSAICFMIAHAGAVFTSTFCYIMPLFAILVSHLLLGDDLGWTHIAGMAITLAGAWLVNRKPEKIGGGAPLGERKELKRNL